MNLNTYPDMDLVDTDEEEKKMKEYEKGISEDEEALCLIGEDILKHIKALYAKADELQMLNYSDFAQSCSCNLIRGLDNLCNDLRSEADIKGEHILSNKIKKLNTYM